MATEPKAEAAPATEEPTAKFEVLKPFKHVGKDRVTGDNVMLTESMAAHLVALGHVRVAPKAH